MNPFCYVVEESGWDNTHVEIFPSYELMLEYLRKEIQGERINQVHLYSVLPDKKRNKIIINKSDLINKVTKSVVVQERIVEEQDEISWKE